MNEEEPLRQYLRAAMAGDAVPGGDHLTEEQMISFCRSGQLPEGPGSVARAHLSECSQCIQLFHDVWDFVSPVSGEEATPAPAGIKASWAGVRGQLDFQRLDRSDSRSRVKKRRFFGAFLAPALAAAVVLIAAGSAIWIVRLKDEKTSVANQLDSERQSYLARLDTSEREKRDIQAQADASRKEYEEKLSQQQKLNQANANTSGKSGSGQSLSESSPILNVPLIDVFPSGSVQRSGSGQGNQASVPSGIPAFVLILNTAGLPQDAAYRVEILNQSGQTVWRGGGLKRDQTGNLTLMLSRSIVPRGSYVIRLYGESNAGEPIGDYNIKVN